MPPSPFYADRRFVRYALLILALFLAVRAIFYSQLFHSPVVDYPTLDSEYYYLWADYVASGHGQPPGAFWLSPLYAMFMAGLFKGLATRSIAVVVLSQYALSLGVLAAIMYFTYRLFGSVAALAAGVVGALYAPWLYYDGVMLSATLILFLNAALLLLLITQTDLVLPAETGRGNSLKRDSIWIALGVITGLSALARPSVLVFASALVVWMVIRKHPYAARRAGFFIAATLLVLAPALIRNYKASGSAVLTTSSGGVNFFIGNRAGASGMYDELDFIKSFDPSREAEGYRAEASKRVGHELNLNQASRYWGGQALDDIIHAPADWIRLLFKKAWLTVQREEIANNISFRGVAGFTPILGALPVRWGLLFPLAVAGAFLAWRKRKDMKLFWIYGASYLAVNLIFFSASEYRFPLLLILLPAAGCFFVEMWRAIVSKDYPELIKACAVYIAALVVCNFPSAEVAHATRPYSDYYNMATVAVDREQWVDAVPLYARSLMINPDYHDSRVGLADALWKLGNYDDARKEYARAGVTPPDSLSGEPLESFLDVINSHVDNDDFKGALAIIDSMFPAGKEAPTRIWATKAMIEEKLKQPDKAIEDLLMASKRDSDSPVFLFGAGQIAERQGNTARADSFYNAAVTRYPAYAPARLALGNLALAQKDSATARSQLEELRKIHIPDDSVRTQVWRLAVNLGESYDLQQSTDEPKRTGNE
jgi:tetratricopeptide (TPR) repeat protein